MTNLILVDVMDLMRVGDDCIFLTEQAYKPEYGITTNKEYQAKVTEIHGSYQVWCDLINDNGEKVTHARVTGFAAGGERVTAKVTPEEYVKRALEAHLKHLEEINVERDKRVEFATALYNRRLEKINKLDN